MLGMVLKEEAETEHMARLNKDYCHLFYKMTGRPPFMPSQSAVCDRELCSAERGLLFLSWPPPERCSGPLSHSACMRACALHVAGLCHTHMLAFVSLPPRSHEQGPPVNLSSKAASSHGADDQHAADNTSGEINLSSTSGPDLRQRHSAPNSAAICHRESGL